jgi:hypothetical protein
MRKEGSFGLDGFHDRQEADDLVILSHEANEVMRLYGRGIGKTSLDDGNNNFQQIVRKRLNDTKEIDHQPVLENGTLGFRRSSTARVLLVGLLLLLTEWQVDSLVKSVIRF